MAMSMPMGFAPAFLKNISAASRTIASAVGRSAAAIFDMIRMRVSRRRSTVTRLCKASASPNVSNPEPRFEVEHGTVTVTPGIFVSVCSVFGGQEQEHDQDQEQEERQCPPP